MAGARLMGLLDRLLARDRSTTGDYYPGHPIDDRASRQRRARHHRSGARAADRAAQAWDAAERRRERNRGRR